MEDPTKKGGKAKDVVEINELKLSADGKTVSIGLTQVRPVMQMNIKYNISAEDGTAIKSEIFNTIHKVPGSDAVSGNGSAVGTVK